MLHPETHNKIAVMSTHMERGYSVWCVRRLNNTKTYSNFFFHSVSFPFIFPKQTGDSAVGKATFGFVIFLFLNNLRRCPMFHRVFVQTQIKPGTGSGGENCGKKSESRSFPPHRGQTTSYQARYSQSLAVARNRMTDKLCGFVTQTTPPTPTPSPSSHGEDIPGNILGDSDW